MGEMADFELGCVQDMEELRFNYRMGEMHSSDAYDLGIIDEMGGEIGPYYQTSRSKKRICCKHCGSTEVKWNKFPDGTWRLQNTADRRVHTCENYKGNKHG